MLKAYLAGPIEFQKDFGKGWRKEIAPRLLELGIEAIDPARKAIYKGVFTGTAEFVEAKKAQNWSEFSNFMHRIWMIDKN